MELKQARPKPRRGPRRSVLGIALVAACTEAAPPADALDLAAFVDPPTAFGPHVRWWWPGGAVDEATIAREVGRLADAGFGGIEQQTLVFGLSDADVAADPRVRTVGTHAQLALVKAFLVAARARDLRASITLGSGWPSGGAFSSDVRPRELLLTRVDVEGPAELSIPEPVPAEPGWVRSANAVLPVLGPFDPTAELVAVLLAPVLDADVSPPVLGPPEDVTRDFSDGRLVRNVGDGPHAVLFVHAHTVDHHVVGAAFPGDAADAAVVDHLDPRGSSAVLDEQIGPWLQALAPEAPDELFVDSFELVGELPWAPAMATRFAEVLGYPLAPELPFVLRADGEVKYTEILRGASDPAYAAQTDRGERAREDYEAVRGDLFREAFLQPVLHFAAERGAALRLQAHGGYLSQLDGYALADVPESEALFAGGALDFLELAASAAHVAGRTTVSSESFVSVNPAATPMGADELWMLAGRAYTAGINRLVFHGVAYPYTRPNGDRWFPFQPNAREGVVAPGPIPFTSDVDPGDPSLPGFTRALARLTFALTQGVDRAEVAWLLPERELPDVVSLRIDTIPPEDGESATSLVLRRAGYLYDRISPSMLASATVEQGRLRVGEATYAALLLPPWGAAAPEEVEAGVTALAGGVPVLFTGDLPARARGLADAEARDNAVAAAVARLREGAVAVSDVAGLPAALAEAEVLPALDIVATTCPTVSLSHRELAGGDVFLVFSEHAAPCAATLATRAASGRVRALDPASGTVEELDAADGVHVELAGCRPLLLLIEP